MMVGQIFTKIGNFIENRQIFMLLNCNCAKLANFEDFKTCLGAIFSWTQCRMHCLDYHTALRDPTFSHFDRTRTCDRRTDR